MQGLKKYQVQDGGFFHEKKDQTKEYGIEDKYPGVFKEYMSYLHSLKQNQKA